MYTRASPTDILARKKRKRASDKSRRSSWFGSWRTELTAARRVSRRCPCRSREVGVTGAARPVQLADKVRGKVRRALFLARMSVGDARVYTCTCTVHDDKLSCTPLQNYTIGASLVRVGPVEFKLYTALAVASRVTRLVLQFHTNKASCGCHTSSQTASLTPLSTALCWVLHTRQQLIPAGAAK